MKTPILYILFAILTLPLTAVANEDCGDWLEFFTPKASPEALKNAPEPGIILGEGDEAIVLARTVQSGSGRESVAEKSYRRLKEAKAGFQLLTLLREMSAKGLLDGFAVVEPLSQDGKVLTLPLIEGRDVRDILESETLDMQGQDRVFHAYDKAIRETVANLEDAGFKVHTEKDRDLIDFIVAQGKWKSRPVSFSFGIRDVIVEAKSGKMIIVDSSPI